MTRISKRKEKERKKEQKNDDPWLSWRSGLLTITVASLALAAFMVWQIYPVGGLGEALLWGGIAGVSIWVVFFASYFISGRIRGR